VGGRDRLPREDAQPDAVRSLEPSPFLSSEHGYSRRAASAAPSSSVASRNALRKRAATAVVRPMRSVRRESGATFAHAQSPPSNGQAKRFQQLRQGNARGPGRPNGPQALEIQPTAQGRLDGPGTVVRVHLAACVSLISWLTTHAFAGERCTESYSIWPRGLHRGDGTYKG